MAWIGFWPRGGKIQCSTCSANFDSQVLLCDTEAEHSALLSIVRRILVRTMVEVGDVYPGGAKRWLRVMTQMLGMETTYEDVVRLAREFGHSKGVSDRAALRDGLTAFDEFVQMESAPLAIKGRLAILQTAAESLREESYVPPTDLLILRALGQALGIPEPQLRQSLPDDEGILDEP